jgi:hypothetical protein
MLVGCEFVRVWFWGWLSASLFVYVSLEVQHPPTVLVHSNLKRNGAREAKGLGKSTRIAKSVFVGQ